LLHRDPVGFPKVPLAGEGAGFAPNPELFLTKPKCIMNTHKSIARIPKVSSSAAEVSGSNEASTGATTLSARTVIPVPLNRERRSPMPQVKAERSAWTKK